MTYRAEAVSIKSKGGKGSRGVALFSHGPSEAIVHLVEGGERLCGTTKRAKLAWTLSDSEARSGAARRIGYRLSVCKNCQTHI